MTNHFKHLTLNNEISIKKFNAARKLKRCNRLSGFNTIKNYSVAEHSYYVGLLFIDLCDKLNIRPTINTIKYVFTHDILETVTGDVLRPAKEFNNRVQDSWITIEREIMYSSEFSHLNIAEDFKEEEYKLLKLCDVLELLMFCHEEQVLGNKNEELYNVYKNCLHYLEESTPDEWKDEIWKYI